MTPPTDLTLVLRAISFAAERHLGQMRKDGRTPYAAHPARVMTLLALEFGVTDGEVLAAAALHDVLEDTRTDYDDLVDQFGQRVAAMVAALTKDKRLPEAEREEAYFRGLAAAPIEVKLCKLGDTLDNLIDSCGLAAAAQRKTCARATELLATLEPGIPSVWEHAVAKVRATLEQVQGPPNPTRRYEGE
jgi:guanosine-3',5'-bis(diphosphate) 3'-pyrophosphohydrolase